VIFIGGHFSHGVRKEAMLGEARLGREERISARAPSDQALAIARYALSVLPFRSPLLYARIDLLEGDARTGGARGRADRALALPQPRRAGPHAPRRRRRRRRQRLSDEPAAALCKARQRSQRERQCT